MENLAHTLLGLSFAKAGLERVTPLATTALVISSNLPDIDVLSRIEGGTVSYLEYHRGFTHGFVGLLLVAAPRFFLPLPVPVGLVAHNRQWFVFFGF